MSHRGLTANEEWREREGEWKKMMMDERKGTVGEGH